MRRSGVYQDKLYLMRQWPVRSYHVVRGTVSTLCSDDKVNCQLAPVLDFVLANPTLDMRTGDGSTFDEASF